MSFRIVSISKPSSLSLRQGYMVVKQEDQQLIHIKEINVLMIESQVVTLTIPLLNKLIDNNVNVILCDDKHNPNVQCLGIKNHSRRTKRIYSQISWMQLEKNVVWQKIIQEKIKGQAIVIRKYEKEVSNKLLGYIENVQPGDITNREGHAAKVYFNKLFYLGFTRLDSSPINASLNFGYQVILSCITRCIVSRGYLPELGIFHHSEYNAFNFSSDLIEPYRPFIDRIVKENISDKFEKEERDLILRSLNDKILQNGKKQRLINSIPIYVDSVIRALEESRTDEILFPKVQFDEF